MMPSPSPSLQHTPSPSASFSGSSGHSSQPSAIPSKSVSILSSKPSH